MRFLDNRDLIRRLKEGSPIEVEGEQVRLPRFSEIKESMPSDFGARGKEELIVARARTATWCVWPLNRKAKFAMKDCRKFISILDAIRDTLPQKPVKGWVLTTGPVDEETRNHLAEAGHRISRITA